MTHFSRVYIEISNICNLQCDFCPEVQREKQIMRPDLFAQLLTELQGLTDEITFHVMGEPLAHPQFAELAQIAAEKGLPVNLTTNGTLLQMKQNANVLLSPAFRQVNFSLQSYFSNFPNGDIQNYLGPIFAWTHRALSERPDLYINFRIWNDGAPQAALQRETLLALIEQEFQVEVKRHVDVAFQKSRNLAGRLYLHYDSRFEWPHMSTAEPKATGTCYGLRSHIAVHADGTVVPCCLDKEAQLALGRVGTEALSLLQILKSQRAANMRQGFENFELREVLCQKCSYVRRFDRKTNRAVVSKSDANFKPDINDLSVF